MSVEIRHVRAEEFDDFMRYVERAFGHSKRFFERLYPHVYKPTKEALEWAYVVDEDGEIVSHVGLYPIETVTAGVRLSVGGIGAVSTAPQARGKGYMTRLLYHVIDEMRRIGYPVSWLGGDRQRYNTFGWEIGGPVYTLSFTRRSLAWYDVEPVEVEEVLPDEAVETIRRYISLPACHAIRPYLDEQVHKMDLRYWIAEDGYAILAGQGRHQVRILELVSASGHEAGMIRAILNWNFGERANWELSAWDTERLGRLTPLTSWWNGDNNRYFRINDLTQLLTAARPHLVQRAQALRNFAVAIGLREHDRTTVTTVHVEDGEVAIEPGKTAETYVELSPVEATRFFLGGPSLGREPDIPAGLQALMPVPVYVFPMDFV